MSPAGKETTTIAKMSLATIRDLGPTRVSFFVGSFGLSKGPIFPLGQGGLGGQRAGYRSFAHCIFPSLSISGRGIIPVHMYVICVHVPHP